MTRNFVTQNFCLLHFMRRFMRQIQHMSEISRVQLISYKCCIWKCLLFVLFSPSHFQWWMVHSHLGTMKRCITSPQRLYNKPNRRNSTPYPIFDKINKLSTQYWGARRGWSLSPEALMLVGTGQKGNPEWTLSFRPSGFFSWLFH